MAAGSAHRRFISSVWRVGAGCAPRARPDGCAKRNNPFPVKTQFSSRGSSLYGLQKSAREVDLGVDPEEQPPVVIPGPIQPNERVFPGILITKPPPPGGHCLFVHPMR